MRDTERKAETKAEGEAGSMQGAQCRTPSWDSRIPPKLKTDTQLLSHPGTPPCLFFLIFKKDFIYLFMRDTVREAETQIEGEAGSMQGAQCRTRSWDPRTMPWAKGRCSTAEPPRDPTDNINFDSEDAIRILLNKTYQVPLISKGIEDYLKLFRRIYQH